MVLQKQQATQSHQDQRNDYPEKRNNKTRSSNHSGAIRVVSLCILGVTISSDLKMDQHINRVLSSASSSLYSLSTLRSKGLPADSLHLVAQATTLSSAMYASPAWWGFATAQNRDKVKALISRLKRRGFLHPEHPSADGIAAKADKALFSAICMNPNHVLIASFRPKQHQYHMRTRAHNFSLPPKDDRNFLSRNVYRNIN